MDSVTTINTELDDHGTKGSGYDLPETKRFTLADLVGLEIVDEEEKTKMDILEG